MALKVASPTPQPKLTVAKPTAQPVLKVTNNYGFQGSTVPVQGSTYTPQKTAPSTVLQNPTYNPQASTYNPQQQAATAAAIAQAAAAAQQQAIAAAARAKEILRGQVQGQVDTKTATNLQQIKIALAAPSWKGRLTVDKKQPNVKIVLPEQTDYEKAYAKAYNEALADFDKQRQPGKQGFWQKVGDKLTFGQDRRDVAARKYAEEQAKKIQNTDFSGYENKINAYIKKQAAVQSAVNNAALTMTQAEFDKYVADQQAAIDKEYQSLVSEGASYDAKQEAYGKSSQRPLTSFSAKTLKKAGWLVSDKNPVWRGTLGSGWENVPSIVSTPARVANWVGNINTKDRVIQQYGGTTANRTTDGKNAWQSTYNQRNWNLRPWTDRKFTDAEKERMFGKEADKQVKNWKNLDGKKIGWTGTYNSPGSKVDPKLTDRKYWLDTYAEDYNRQHRFKNSLLEIGSDPLIIGGELKDVAKGTKFASKLDELGRSTKATGWAFKAADKVSETKAAFASKLKENKVVSWLTKEHKTPGETFLDTQKAVRDLSRAEQDTLLKKLQDIGKKLAANPKYDLSIFDELKSLSPKEREVLQRMSGDGKLALRDRLLMSGKSNAAARFKFEDLAKRYTAFTEEMKVADNVRTTRFGLGKKRIYSPRTAWADDLEKYNFRLFRKGRQVQSGDDFLHGVIDRFFKSNLDEKLVGQGKNFEKYSRQFKSVSGEYTKSFENARNAISEAKSKLRHDTTGITGWLRNKNAVRSDLSAGRALFNTGKSTLQVPTKIWKKSVLGLRPAWYVNNEMYNTQAAVLAGGFDALAEKAHMLSPRYWRKAMDEGAAFRSNIGKEVGRGWLGRFASNQEDWSRVAAGRAAMKKGLTEEQAVGRVNKYLFDYKTANWERPIKSAIPFWSFSKNLAKAAATMPFDRPLAAVGYNRLDRYQQTQYDQEFSKLVPELTKLGYTEEEIQGMKEENAKYFRGRLKVGSRWFTTPFNAFSEKGLTNMGINPYLAAGREVATSTDSFNRPVSGKESGFMRRILSKFPQVEIGRQLYQSHQVDTGKLKPSVKYIGKPGSEGYGLGKEKQGFDSKKANYVKSMDPRQKLGDNILAFAGVPKSFQFDEKGFVKGKMLQKLTGEYFGLDTKGMKWDDAEAKRQELFDKYGVTADQFYKGVLSKYDTENTKHIKDQKEVAKVANDLLFDEYGKQAYGTRSAWAVKKLEELNKSGYYKDNPFLYSFVKSPNNPKGFLTPDSIHKIQVGQQKKADYEYAIRTGDWSKWAAKYGIKSEKARLVQQALKTGDWSAYEAKYGRTEKALARDKALATGNWTDYANKYGVNKKETPFQYAGKFFKSAETMAKYKEGEFWGKYADATPEDRKKLLADNPQYNTRGNWTAAMWLADKKQKRAELKKRAKGFGNIDDFIAKNTATINVKSTRFKGSLNRRQKKVVYNLS